MARALERYDIAWLEEPTPPKSIDALADVRAHSPVPIAAGERFFEPERFLEAITKRAVDILQPDVGRGGHAGDEDRRFRPHAMLPVAPHNPTGPVMNAMTLHLSAAIVNFSIFETVMIDAPWRRELVTESLELDRGAIIVPTSPGPRCRAHRGGLREISLSAPGLSDLHGQNEHGGRRRRIGGRGTPRLPLSDGDRPRLQLDLASVATLWFQLRTDLFKYELIGSAPRRNAA